MATKISLIDKLYAERDELWVKLSKLNEFLAIDAPGVSQGHRDLLIRQQKAMRAYYDALDARIAMLP